MSLRLLVVLNPSACDFEARDRWPDLEPILRRMSDVTLVETDPDDERTDQRIRHALEAKPDRVLAIGGDGTIHLTINAIASVSLDNPPQFAVIPFGTANNVARSLRLPLKDLEGMARIAVGPHLEALDIARIRTHGGDEMDERFWINCAGIGMDADVVAARGRHRKLGGYLSYAAAVLERSVEQRSLDVHIVVDGQAYDARVFNLILTNVPIYAGAFELPGSRGDGLLDVHLLDRIEYGSKMLTFAVKKVDVLNLGLSEALESITANQRTLNGRSVRIRLASPRRIQIDGEGLGAVTDIEADIVGRLWVAGP